MDEHFFRPDTYAVWSKDEKVRYNSTSGGAFSEFAKIILNENGFIVGARYNKDNLVEHAIVNDFEGLEKLRQSKYISSSLGQIYRDIKEKLYEGKIVGFCGSPCQIAGLYSFLGKSYNNLITMDFICRGMNSPKAFKAWIEEIEIEEGSKVNRVWFKYKDKGWKISPRRTRIDFEDGHFVVKEAENNLFMQGYLNFNLYTRPCCGYCPFKGTPRQADITFADFWGIEEELDDDRGTSLLLLNSEKGIALFKKVEKNLVIHQRSFEEIAAGNSSFYNSEGTSENSCSFLKELDNRKFSYVLKKYSKISNYKRNVAKIKKIIKRLIRLKHT